MRKLIPILICCLCANAARGGIIVSIPDSGWYNQGNLVGEDAGWDATAGNMNFSRDERAPIIGTHNERINGSQASLILGGSGARLQDMCIQLEGLPGTPLDYISILNATLDEESAVDGFDEIIAGYRETADLQYAHINNSEGQLSDMDFLLEGTLYIDWTGTVPSNDETGMRVTMSQIPEPASIVMVIMVSGLGLIVRRRFRP